MLSSKPLLFPNKRLTGPQCGPVFSGGMHNDLSLIQHSRQVTVTYAARSEMNSPVFHSVAML